MMEATRPAVGPGGTETDTEEIDFETNNQELGHEHTEQTPEKFCRPSSGVLAFAVGAIALWAMIWMVAPSPPSPPLPTQHDLLVPCAVPLVPSVLHLAPCVVPLVPCVYP